MGRGTTAGARWLAGPALAVFAAVGASGEQKAAAGTDWFQWRGPRRDGISLETGWTHVWPANGPRRLWRLDVGYGMCSVATRGDRVFTMGNVNNTDIVYCLDAKTGAKIWRHRYVERRQPRNFPGGPAATPTVIGGRVYTLSREGRLHCLDEKTGTVLWMRNLRKDTGAKPPNWGFASSPLLVGKRVFVNVGRSGAALHADTGEILWHSPAGISGFASVVPIDQPNQRAVAVFGNKALWAVRQDNGEVVWRHPWPTSFGENTADPLPVGDKLYFSSAHGRGAALLQLRDGPPRVLWRNEQFGNHVDAAVLWKGRLYGFDGRVNRRGGRLMCVDFKSGKTLWTRPDLKGSLNLADGKLLIMTLRGKLIVARADPGGYKELASAQVLSGKCWTPPVLSAGRLYCRSGEGTLLCLDVRNP